MKTAELTGKRLNWAVAKAIGKYSPTAVPEYSTDWAHGGPIIEREKINVSSSATAPWMAWFYDGVEMIWLTDGQTPLIAAMRCYVASNLGDDVEIPKETT